MMEAVLHELGRRDERNKPLADFCRECTKSLFLFFFFFFFFFSLSLQTRRVLPSSCG